MTRGRARTGAFFPGSGRRPIQHGTMGGYRAHYRHGDLPACEPCKRAESARMGYKGPQKVAQCGTVAGYRRHKRLGEPVDAACLAANAAQRRRYSKRDAA